MTKLNPFGYDIDIASHGVLMKPLASQRPQVKQIMKYTVTTYVIQRSTSRYVNRGPLTDHNRFFSHTYVTYLRITVHRLLKSQSHPKGALFEFSISRALNIIKKHSRNIEYDDRSFD